MRGPIINNNYQGNLIHAIKINIINSTASFMVNIIQKQFLIFRKNKLKGQVQATILV